MSTPSNSEPSASADQDGAGDEQGHAPADDDTRRREERAVDASTAERLSGGVRRDQHGEYEPDPYPEGEDPGDTSEDVIDLHRQQAERIEHQPDVPRADE